MIIFGAGKLSEIGGGVAKSIKAFKKEMKDEQIPSTIEQDKETKDWCFLKHLGGDAMTELSFCVLDDVFFQLLPVVVVTPYFFCSTCMGL